MSDTHVRHPSIGHEEDDVRGRPLYLAALGLIVGLIVSGLAMWLLLDQSLAYHARTSVPADPLAESYGRQLPPEPRLQSEPILDLEHLRQREDKRLSGYGWVDQPGGAVHIPISRAMELIANEGLGVAGQRE